MSRLFIFILFILASFSNANENENFGEKCRISGKYECCLDSSQKSPFAVSDEYYQGDLKYEKLREVEDDRLWSKYAPLGTIVHTPPELYELEASVDYRLPVRVASVPNSELEETSKGTVRDYFKKFFRGKKRKSKVKVGDIGFMDKRSLRRIDEFSFFVNEDAPSYKTPKGYLLNDNYIKPKMMKVKVQAGDKVRTENHFVITRCCEPDENGPEGMKCYDFNVFEVLNKQGNIIDHTNLQMNCRILENIAAIPNSDVNSISSFVDLLKESAATSDVFNAAGANTLSLVNVKNRWNRSRRLNKPKIELIKFPFDSKTKYGPFNTRIYGQDDKGGSDTYVRPYAGCAFLQLAKEFQKECKGAGCEIQVGDIFHKKNWGDHKTHESGNCFDIRPFRKKTDNISVGKTWHKRKLVNGKWVNNKEELDEDYDREKTKRFMELAIQAGATSVFFNDPAINSHFLNKSVRDSISSPISGVSTKDHWWVTGGRERKGHDNHLHFCFGVDHEKNLSTSLKEAYNSRVKSTCQNGIKQ